MAPRLRIPTSLAVVVVGASATAALMFACDQPVMPDPVDAGRLEKTSDAHQADGSHVDGAAKSDAVSVVGDAPHLIDAPRMPDAFVPKDAPPDAPPDARVADARMIDAPPDTPQS